jgi:hypothetical protein
MAFALGITPVPGYPQPWGTKYVQEIDRTGPSSYTQVVTGTTPSGGDKLNASDIGMGGIEHVDPDFDSTGQIVCDAIIVGSGNGNAVPYAILIYTSNVSATLGGQVQTAGTQIVAGTNLSTFSFRIRVTAV